MLDYYCLMAREFWAPYRAALKRNTARARSPCGPILLRTRTGSRSCCLQSSERGEYKRRPSRSIGASALDMQGSGPQDPVHHEPSQRRRYRRRAASPRRCFGNVRTRALNRSEAAILITRVCGEQQEIVERTMQSALPDDSVSVTLAALYRHLPTSVANRHEPHQEYRLSTGDLHDSCG
jgi:hypothetical protein